MDRVQLENYVIKVLTQELSKEELPIKLAFFKRLWSNNVIDEPRLLKGCINHFYDNVFKENNHCTKDSVMDTAIEFEITISKVKNTIYDFSHVRLIF